MEYQRIHHLLDKYWECATSVEEERELRHFFTSGGIPPELLPYKAWFVSHEAESLSPLGADFDERVLARISREKRARRRRYFCYGLIGLFSLFVAGVLIFWFMPFLFPF